MPAVRSDRFQVPAAAYSSPPNTRPDIYVFVLDGYTRADILKHLYRHDDTFVGSLVDDGFYVASHASSNYCQTALSLASSLNLDYLPGLLDGLPSDAVSRSPCGALIAENRTFRILRDAGYRVATFASEYAMLRFRNVDIEYAPTIYLTDFGASFFSAGLPTMCRLLGLPPHGCLTRSDVVTSCGRSRSCRPDESLLLTGRPLSSPTSCCRTHRSSSDRRTVHLDTIASGHSRRDHWRAIQADRDVSYEVDMLTISVLLTNVFGGSFMASLREQGGQPSFSSRGTTGQVLDSHGTIRERQMSANGLAFCSRQGSRRAIPPLSIQQSLPSTLCAWF